MLIFSVSTTQMTPQGIEIFPPPLFFSLVFDLSNIFVCCELLFDTFRKHFFGGKIAKYVFAKYCSYFAIMLRHFVICK